MNTGNASTNVAENGSREVGLGQRVRGSSLDLHAGGKTSKCRLCHEEEFWRSQGDYWGIMLLSRTSQALASWVIGGWFAYTYACMHTHIARYCTNSQRAGRETGEALRAPARAESQRRSAPGAHAPGPRPRDLPSARPAAAASQLGQRAARREGQEGLPPPHERWAASHWLPSLRPRSPLAAARAHGPSTPLRAARCVAGHGDAANGSARGAGPRTTGARARASW